MNIDMPTQSGPTHATMTDVARTAGVSIKSVSRVINNEAHVSARLRVKVESAIAALDYVPDTAARSLAGARSFIIGVLFDNPSPNYTMKIVSGAYRACVASKYHLRFDNLASMSPDTRLEDQLSNIIRNSRCDGFILTPPLTDNPAVLAFLEARGVPYSRIAPVFAPERSAAVMIDDDAAAALVADMLWDKGHRRIALVNGPPEHGAARSRREGFIGRLRERDPEIFVSEADGGFTFEGGVAAGQQVLAARRAPTAIFATNDDSAAGVIAACARMGFSVPDDISVCGFDDSWIAMSVWPFLTTIRQPIEEMAFTAAMLLLDRNRPADDRSVVRLGFELVERDSVKDMR